MHYLLANQGKLNASMIWYHIFKILTSMTSRFIASYCLRATATLFRNIIQNPRNVQATHDLELIRVSLLLLEERDKKNFHVDQVAYVRNLYTAARIAIEFVVSGL